MPWNARPHWRPTSLHSPSTARHFILHPVRPQSLAAIYSSNVLAMALACSSMTMDSSFHCSISQFLILFRYQRPPRDPKAFQPKHSYLDEYWIAADWLVIVYSNQTSNQRHFPTQLYPEPCPEITIIWPWQPARPRSLDSFRSFGLLGSSIVGTSYSSALHSEDRYILYGLGQYHYDPAQISSHGQVLFETAAKLNWAFARNGTILASCYLPGSSSNPIQNRSLPVFAPLVNG